MCKKFRKIKSFWINISVIFALLPKIQFYPKNGVVKIQKAINFTILHRYNMKIPYVVTHRSPNITTELGKSSCLENNTSNIQTEIEKYLAEVMQKYIIEQNFGKIQQDKPQIDWHFPGDTQNLIRNLECSVVANRPLCSSTKDQNHCNNNLNCCFSTTDNKCYGHIFPYEPFFNYVSKIPNTIPIKSIVYIPPNQSEVLMDKLNLQIIIDNNNKTKYPLVCEAGSQAALFRNALPLGRAKRNLSNNTINVRALVNFSRYSDKLPNSKTPLRNSRIMNPNIKYEHSWIVNFNITQVQSVSIFSTRNDSEKMTDYLKTILTPKHTVIITTLNAEGIYERAKKTQCSLEDSYPGEYIFDCKGGEGNALIFSFEFTQQFCRGITLNDIIISEKTYKRSKRQVAMIFSALSGIFGGTIGGSIMGSYAAKGIVKTAIHNNNRIIFDKINNNYERVNKLHKEQYQYLQLFQDNTHKNFENIKVMICDIENQIFKSNHVRTAQMVVQKYIDDIDKSVMAFEVGIMPYGNPHYKRLLQLCLTINSVAMYSWKTNTYICEELLYNKIVKIDHIKAQIIGNNSYQIDIVGYFEIPKIHILKTDISEIYNIPVPKETDMNGNKFEYTIYNMPILEMKLESSAKLPVLEGQCTFSNRLNFAIFCKESMLNQLNEQNAFCLNSIGTDKLQCDSQL